MAASDPRAFVHQPAPEPGAGDRVLVGLSGGVDSALAAHELRARGCELVGVTTKNFCFGEPPFENLASGGSCCDAEAIESARDLCAQLDMPHQVLDLSEPFGREVIDDWRAGYRAGRTPSPCVRCNSFVRFPSLLALADRLGVRWVATGHYARRVRVGDAYFVRQAADEQKDQSYFLHRLSSETIARLVFPLAELAKPDVRRAAEREGIAAATRPDSQELCFVPDGNRRPLLEAGARGGEIVDQDGRVLGSHPGIEFFTVGQRRGIGIAAAEPLHVLRLDPELHRVVVGPASALDADHILCEDAVWRDPLGGAPGLVAKTRYRHRGLPVASLQSDEGRLELRLHEADRAPAPGQSLVLSRDGVVVGGATIKSAFLGSS